MYILYRETYMYIVYTCTCMYIFTCTFISDGWKGTQPSPLLKAHGMNNISEAFANGSQVRTS